MRKPVEGNQLRFHLNLFCFCFTWGLRPGAIALVSSICFSFAPCRAMLWHWPFISADWRLLCDLCMSVFTCRSVEDATVYIAASMQHFAKEPAKIIAAPVGHRTAPPLRGSPRRVPPGSPGPNSTSKTHHFFNQIQTIQKFSASVRKTLGVNQLCFTLACVDGV